MQNNFCFRLKVRKICFCAMNSPEFTVTFDNDVNII